MARQIELVEQMIARGVQAIVLAPADSRALVAVAQRAMEAGIVVVNIDNRFDAAVLAERRIAIPFVGPDNRKGARMSARRSRSVSRAATRLRSSRAPRTRSTASSASSDSRTRPGQPA